MIGSERVLPFHMLSLCRKLIVPHAAAGAYACAKVTCNKVVIIDGQPLRESAKHKKFQEVQFLVDISTLKHFMVQFLRISCSFTGHYDVPHGLFRRSNFFFFFFF